MHFYKIANKYKLGKKICSNANNLSSNLIDSRVVLLMIIMKDVLVNGSIDIDVRDIKKHYD